jgi:HEAT repeat protein
VFRSDRSYFVSAEALRGFAETQGHRAAGLVKGALNRNSWNDTYRATAVSVLQKLSARDALRLARQHARYGHSPSVRGSAVGALARIAPAYPEAFADLIALTQDPQIRLRHAAISALGNLRDPRALPALEKVKKDKRLPYRTQALAEDAILKIQPDKAES